VCAPHAGHAVLAPAVPLIQQSLAAYRQAEAALLAQQAEAQAALAALGRTLERQGQESRAEAEDLARQPRCLELVSCVSTPTPA
jgi:hypothetical protein